MSSLLFVQGIFETGIRAAYGQLQSSTAHTAHTGCKLVALDIENCKSI